MDLLNYYMPTKVILDEEVVLKNSNLFCAYGEKALIVTGKMSSSINGSLKDITDVLLKKGIIISACFHDPIHNGSIPFKC